MENKLWFILLVVSAMTSLTSQGLMDFSGLMGTKETTTTTPAPKISQDYSGGGQYNQYNQYGQHYNQQAQKPNKGVNFMKPNLPQKPTFPGIPSKDQLKQDLKLDKFDKPDKLDLKQDKLDNKPDKMNYTQDYNNNNNYRPYDSSLLNIAAPVENPVYSSYVPQLSPPVPVFDDGSYSQPPQQYGTPQYGSGQFRTGSPQYGHSNGQSYGNRNNLTAYSIYRQMYGYDKAPAQNPPNYGSRPTTRPSYGPPPMQQQISNYGQPSNSYNEAPVQYGASQTYGPSPPPSYGEPQAPAYGSNRPQSYGSGNGPVYGVDATYDQGYHEEPSYHGPDSNSYSHIDYSKYVAPMPYSELSEYMSPAQYNDYTGMLYNAYNVPSPGLRTYSPNYTKTNYNSDFRMVVAVVVLDGNLGVPQRTNVRGTLFISEIYPFVCLVSGVVTGLPPNYKYGIAIHTFGDVTNGCGSIGGHYNPLHKNHGNINYVQSHAGDLGNIQSDNGGIAFVNKISRNQFSIQGRNPVAGRAIGICDKQDDLGQGGNVQSLRDGSCGGIQACGIIGLANTGAPNSNSGSPYYKK